MNAPKIDTEAAVFAPFVYAVAEQLRAENGAHRGGIRGIAKEAGMAPSTLTRLIRPETPARVDQLASLARVYGISVSELMRRAERRMESEDLMVSRSQELG